MARFLCKCGKILSNRTVPNDVMLIVYTDYEWDNIISSNIIDPLDIPDPKHDVWRCPKCERLYFFDNNKAIKTYKLEE